MTAALRVQTYAERVELDDGAVAYRGCVRLSSEIGVEEFESRDTFPTEDAALADARVRSERVMGIARAHGGRVQCTRCGRSVLEGSCGCADKEAP